ncbi:uncharacterized protein [Typha angustifolia]|uniref:uncharacterized protein n=1 Tax=Typha angustifolia TaxID=59011 RepID=UPI003C302425
MGYPLDITLVPLSLFLTAGYHAYLWQRSKAKHPATTIGITIKRRTKWIRTILQEKKGMLGVQSLRNTLMSAILSATVAILINTAMAALANNAYNSSHLLRREVFGAQGGSTILVKYGSASLLLLLSFLCSSMAVGTIIDANFLINATGELLHEQTEKMLKRGWVLATVGNRLLFSTLPFLLWLFGPVPLAVSSLVMVLAMYNLDFKCHGFNK